MVARQVTPKGACQYCQKQFSKGSINRHLQSCEKRAEVLDAYAHEHPEVERQRILRLAIDGKYSPQYWMQIEIAAEEDVIELDEFLRRTWFTDNDHMSGFSFPNKNLPRKEDFIPRDSNALRELAIKFHLLEETDDPESSHSKIVEVIITSELERILRDAKASTVTFSPLGYEKIDIAPTPEELAEEYQQQLKRYAITLNDDEEEDTNTNVALEDEDREKDIDDEDDEDEDEDDEILPIGLLVEVGTEFTYDYDFGSTTTVRLKVVGEREDIIPAEESVIVLARNELPEVLCEICEKKPAEVVCIYCGQEGRASWFCEEDAEKHLKNPKFEDHEYQIYDVENSPRTGTV